MYRKSLFDDFFDAPFDGGAASGLMKTDIKATDEGFELEIDLPGIDKENMANQINLTYTKYFEEAIGFVDEGKFQCSFILNPTRVTEIRDVAAAGEKMPQKSTYFYPKMITGLVMNDLSIK